MAESTGHEPNIGGFSPTQPGWHEYHVGPTLICTSKQDCTPQEIADQMARFAFPGQNPTQPARNGKIYKVHDPRTELYAGDVSVWISPNGLTTINRTQPNHVLYDGQIVRVAARDKSGSWYVTTHGIGNNITFGMAEANTFQGPPIFRVVDAKLRQNIDRHHGKQF